MTSRLEQRDWILARCRELGFALAGIAPADRTQYEEEFRAWLARGEHGEMEYMARNVSLRVDPAEMVDSARSVLCVADRHHVQARGKKTPSADGATVDQAVGRVARYAWGDDYHKVIKKRLHTLADELRGRFPDEVFRVCTDTAPVLEREHAQRAGLGAVGKHTLLIEPGVTSYLLLAEIITTLDLEPTVSAMDVDPCESCTRCIDACPTDAITPFSVDATKCISYLTIEHRSLIDERFHEAMGDWIFGCDICQEVCPHNQKTFRKRRNAVHEAYEPRRTGFDLLEVLNWDEQARRDAFAKSAMKRAKLAMMKRNALIAAGNAIANQEAPALRRRIEAIIADDEEEPMVRETARQTLERLS